MGDSQVGQPSCIRALADRARVLLEINNAVVSHLDLVQVLNAVSACLRSEIKHDFAALALYDPEENQLRLHALDFPADQHFLEKGQLIPLVGTPAALAFSSRKPVLRHRVDPEFTADIMKLATARGIKSGCAVPLICHDKIVGSMALASLHESAFTEDDQELLTQIGVQVAIAVENAQNFEKARRAQQQVTQERDRSRLLLEINNAVVSHLDLRELLKSISKSLRSVIPYDGAFISLCDSEGAQMQAQAIDLQKLDNVDFEENVLIPLEGTPEGEAIATRQPVRVTSVADMKRFTSPWVRYAIERGIKSGCGFPLIAHGHILGVLSVISLQEAKFSEDDVTLLSQCATQIAIAVENALSFEKNRQAEREVRQERDRTRLLLEVNNAVVSHLDLSELLKSISARLGAVISHDSAFISLCDSTGTQLQIQAQELGKMKDVSFEEGLVIPMEGTPEEQAITSHQPVLVPSAADFARFTSPWVHYAVEHGVKSGCFLPLIVHGRTLGAMGMVRLQEIPFTTDDATLLEQCASQIAIAVANALNFGNARRAEREVRQERDRTKLLLDTNNALVSHLDLHELVKVISSSLRQVIHHDSFSLALYDAESGKMFARALDSDSQPIAEGIHYDPKDTVSGRAFETGLPFYLPRPDVVQFPSPVSKSFFDMGMKSLYAVPVAVHGRKLGTLTFASSQEDAWSKDDQELLQEITKQVSIAAANAIAMGELEALKNKLAQEKLYLEDEIRTEFNFDEIVGQSPALREVLRLIETVANSDSTVLLLGETGTGKELIARAVHEHSRRKSRTFVKLNCAAIPTGLLESELFGHEKGAFTGAIAQKIGRLELADQGTLFLDEVGDIPIEIQPKLLRALQEREFERLGSTHTKRVNVRLVAATNRDLEKMIEERQFRSDLYYRLNVFPIRIPPLRERHEDIPLLVRYFAEKLARRMQKPIDSIPADTMARLQAWHWPGNVRELENLIERSVILTTGSALQVPMAELKGTLTGAVSSLPTSTTLETSDRDLIVKVLRETRGILAGPNGAAARLGVKRTTLQYKIKKLGITRDLWWPSH